MINNNYWKNVIESVLLFIYVSKNKHISKINASESFVLAVMRPQFGAIEKEC